MDAFVNVIRRCIRMYYVTGLIVDFLSRCLAFFLFFHLMLPKVKKDAHGTIETSSSHGRLCLIDTPLYLIALKFMFVYQIPSFLSSFFYLFVLFFHLICQNDGLGDFPHRPTRVHALFPDSIESLILQKSIIPH